MRVCVVCVCVGGVRAREEEMGEIRRKEGRKEGRKGLRKKEKKSKNYPLTAAAKWPSILG